MKPRVIWLDDELKKESLKGTVALFRRHFDIIGCENIDEFYRNVSACEWDAAILDVLNSRERASDAHNSILFIKDKFADRPWFVFSGKDRITKRDDDFKETLNGDAYRRSYARETIYIKSEHDLELIEDITKVVTSNRQWLIEKEYERVLSISENMLDNKECRKDLLEIICAAAGVKSINPHLYYNRVRVILEWMFRSCRKLGLLHDKCFDSNDHINLTDASLFMAGLPTLHSGVVCETKHFPCLIAGNVKKILEITGGASHTTEVDPKDNPNLSAYWDEIDTPYLLFGIVYMLCDVLIWFDKYASENGDKEKNKSYWRDLELEGELCQDDKGNFYVGDCLMPYNWSKKQAEGSLVQVTEVSLPDADNTLPYILKAKKFRLSRQ